MFKYLGENIEDTSVYKTKLEDFINSMKGVQLSEQDFRTIVDGSVIYSSMNKELYKHNLIVELPNKFGKIFDSYHYSLGNDSFVIECKVLKFSKKLKSLIKDAQWQLYISNYLHAALQSYKKNNHSMKLVARVVIYKRRLDEKIVHIIDHEYTIEQASRVSKLFYKPILWSSEMQIIYLLSLVPFNILIGKLLHSNKSSSLCSKRFHIKILLLLYKYK